MEQIKKFFLQYKNYKLGVLGLAIVVCIALLSAMAPFIAPYDPYRQSTDIFLGPNSEHPLGTDNLGRDLFSRILYGGRISLIFGLVVGFLSLMVGILLGAIPGYYGGPLDDIFSRFFEVFLMIPRFFLILLVVSLYGNNIFYTMIITAATMWPSNAKITRTQVLTLRKRQYVDAARVSGASSFRILFRHILPNGIYPVIANSTLQMASAIILEAGLSFLGLGDPNFVSWGQLLHGAMKNITYWWNAAFPGIFLLLLALGFNMIGDGINYVLNPRMKERE